MPIRITGMNSGLDTESIITELVKAKSAKKDDLVKAQTKLQWKQDAWKELNTKVYNLYSKTLGSMYLESDYYKKTTKVSNANAATVITGANAVNGVQTLKIDKLAKTAYLTGGQLTTKASSGTKLVNLKTENPTDPDADDKGMVNVKSGSKITLTVGGKSNEIEITDNMTVNDLVKKFKDAGLNASFDEKNQRFFVSAKKTGAAGNFEISGDENTLAALGLKYDKDAVDTADTADQSVARKIDGEDARIYLNGALFTSNSNTFEINGLTITATAETDEEFTISTENDTEGIYDMIKNFFKEYNSLINEMDKLYNAESSKGYEPLTDEEKEAMSEKEVEKWEEKIKDSILRKDSTLSNVASAMKNVMLQGVTMKDGTQMYLSDFGINTLGYFNSADNEKSAYHIDGDPDDTNTSGNGDKLKTAIANNPDQVVDFFTKLSRNLYEKLGEMMKKTDYSSSFTLYDDVAMKEEYKDYTSKISKQEQKITDFEDRYYKKFSAMETALAKLSSKESAISGLFGM